jgi:2-dehydropantoate 2-reductase
VEDKTRIAILGLGGVGAYFGGLLAEKYFKSNAVEIIFIARGKTQAAIQERGLKLITPNSECSIFPALVSNDPRQIGRIDFLICATKSYDLEESLVPFRNNLHEESVILPLLNGVDARERIERIFPGTEVWDGCVYIVSRIIEPGVVKERGAIHSLFYGSGNPSKPELQFFYKLLKEAGIDVHLSDNIKSTIWEKFVFISSIASLTTYLNKPIGEILKREEYHSTLLQLLNEVTSVAKAKQIHLPPDIIERTILKLKSLAPDTFSSMHSDFEKGGRTEHESLTGYVVKLGKELGLKTPAFEMILKDLSSRARPVQ